MRILLDTNYYHESHYAVLPTQSTVYGLTELASKGDKNRVLVTSRLGKILSLEFSDHKDRNGKYVDVKPITKEVQFTFPGKSEVISIDAFYTDHYVVGISLIKPKVKDLDQEQCQYLNIYKDYKPGYEYDLSNIDQYEMIELDFIPYILTHAELNLENKKETVFLLSGGDSKMHIYSQVEQDGKMCYADQTEKFNNYFPEFNKYESCLTCISIRYDRCKHHRITAYGLTSGAITLSVVDYRNSEILMQTTTSHDCPINKLSLFHKDNRSTTMHLVVASSIQPTVVYHDVLRMGLKDNCLMLPGSHMFDCILSVHVVDVDFDGVPEIMIGTYGQELIIYKYFDYLIPEYKVVWQRAFSDPILSLHSTDITGDGVKEVIVLTLRGVHVLQHDLEIVKLTLASRLKEKFSRQQIPKTTKMFKIGSY